MLPASLVEKVEKIKMPFRIAILIGTLALITAGFLFGAYFPKTEEIEKTRKEISGLNRKIQQAKIRKKNLAKFRKEMEEVNRQFEMALRLLPNKREIPSLLRTITQLGNDSNLEFLYFSPGNERPKDFFIEIPVALEVKGTYHDVGTFFDKVGKMERIVNIFGVSMKPVRQRSTTLRTRCEAVTYRFKGTTNEKAPTGKKKK